ncbi:hypothetical protein EMIHUDRAFT_94761 [Emiliania huxleyi CCMP1516]|uniref:F-box domain-containing protein n=2 Tax=Emiliania huxleyi TaxID=2903 RepID=A0A0D3L0E4_EMIH1|nr:hypothetical protein EMIHUDRAFT_94761 [Emiliania huxleyi CCMP1516]EOD41479.1 hypothetical protein EMIHUDRAFT_94761 [Emiliania huxleyi CCMP1516]|eukprot:XP_005793908.1 hypothetical protein EMIHUDRAFT_94761 [Emiliania huxleyi CCMP1516]
MSDSLAVPSLPTLPTELQACVLSLLPARSLCCAACCCSAWQAAAPDLARERLRRLLRPDRAGSVDGCPCLLPALHAAEQLRASVGPWPADRGWRDEWPALRLAQARLLAASKGEESLASLEEKMRLMGGLGAVRAFFAPGNGGSVETEAAHSYAGSLAWKAEAGWPAERAVEVSLLASRCAGALTRSILERRGEHAASCWTLCLALWERGWRQPEQPAHAGDAAAPCSYAALGGEFGLATADPAWEALRAPGARPGLSLVARNVAFAMEANGASFPARGDGAGRGFCVPVTGQGRVTYELVDSDVACFHASRPAADAAADAAAGWAAEAAAAEASEQAAEAAEWAEAAEQAAAAVAANEVAEMAAEVRAATAVEERGGERPPAVARARPSPRAGPRRELVGTDDAIWRLPPFARVTLVGIRPRGAWCAYSRGRPIQQRCFDVVVEF